MHSIFDMFTIGIGPSSSHTVGPMKAAFRFLQALGNVPYQNDINRIEVTLYGSLASTGKGHGTDTAIIFGLLGYIPETIDIESARFQLEKVKKLQSLSLHGFHPIPFKPYRDIIFKSRESLTQHSNGMTLEAFNCNKKSLLKQTYFSIGGGFIVRNDESFEVIKQVDAIKYPYNSFEMLKTLCKKNKKNIAEIIIENEQAYTCKSEIDFKCNQLWLAMFKSVEHGLKNKGELPGGLKLKRRANMLFDSLINQQHEDPLDRIDWLNVFALAVSEENAAGNQVVTAPTNGAAGIIPAILAYINRFEATISKELLVEFFAVATAIGSLYKMNASISGAEVGCQGEVGVACSMAAGALTHIWGGDTAQVENAAEIAMEHHLGLTCDPVGGLVQVPCIERNAVSAVKAINAARLALKNPNEPKVSLDKVIHTMYQTGNDMNLKYKETSRGGLAINVKLVE
ncbi:L-serine ammonia-lyase [Colwellia psychrerythraea]|uniref:L-serine dehydratase n=1 Tax=Colwellia psychrerythraea TaxID=28229 RepID=A0A099KFC7_COLPS|nr:L-serine ammonia-lyase [Colwellia psychrerythraea]KGJ88328.1 L-serine dehydratase 1 [Colwellia psychrerythraea]